MSPLLAVLWLEDDDDNSRGPRNRASRASCSALAAAAAAAASLSLSSLRRLLASRTAGSSSNTRGGDFLLQVMT